MGPSWHGPGWGSWGWGHRSVGIWDLFFLMTVRDMFWYHHWRDPGIQRALYKDNLLQKEEVQRLEKRVAELEKQGVKRNPNYLPEDVDPDLAYSKEYVHHHQEDFGDAQGAAGASDADEDAKTGSADSDDDDDDGVGWLWVLFGLGGAALFFYALFVRRY